MWVKVAAYCVEMHNKDAMRWTVASYINYGHLCIMVRLNKGWKPTTLYKGLPHEQPTLDLQYSSTYEFQIIVLKTQIR